jgi:hypothetical protein
MLLAYGLLAYILIETDELNAIEQLGNIVTIVYGDETIKLSVKTRTQMSFEDSRTKDKGQELKETRTEGK